MNHDDLSEAISEQIKLFWSNSDDEAQLEARAALLNPVSTHCDSNMEACYSATSDEVPKPSQWYGRMAVPRS